MDDLFIVLAIILIPALASLYVNNTYNKYREVKNAKKLSGFEAAREILDKSGLNDIHIVEIKGKLNDHYDPKRRVLRLSSDVFHGESIASVSIAAHEAGHAIQDKEGYFYMKMRSFIYPVVNFSSSIAYFVILFGFLFQILNLIYIGIALVGAGLIFQLITLPVEFDASKKALKNINKCKILSKQEINGSEIMLKSAAWTYVAGVLSSALYIVRLLLLADRD